MNGTAQYAQYDSWLTVGMTRAEQTGALGVIGDDLDTWSVHKGLVTDNGAVFWMNPDDGPSMDDNNGAQGKGSPAGNVVIAQLTVKTGSSFDAQVRHSLGSNEVVGDSSWLKQDACSVAVSCRAGKLPRANK